MNSNSVNVLFKQLSNLVASSLKDIGFEQRGSTIRKINGDSCLLVAFQRSDRSTETRCRFTVNLALLNMRISNSDPRASKLDVTEAHLRVRLGELAFREDKWWELVSTSDVAAEAHGIIRPLQSVGIPYLEQFSNSSALLKLWSAGKSPGLTAAQRTRYMEQLRVFVGDPPDGL